MIDSAVFPKQTLYMRFLISIFLLTVSLDVEAQTAEDSVKQTVNSLFTAMKTSDGNLLRTVFADSAVLQTIALDRSTGLPSIRNQEVSSFVKQVGLMKAGDADERITFEMIKIDADLASVWTPYQFYYKGKFSHCGVNSFQLVRLQGIWKIQYLVDTRRKTGCIE